MGVVRRVIFSVVLVFLLAACVVKTEESTDAVPPQTLTAKPEAVVDAPTVSGPSDFDGVLLQYDVFGGLLAPRPGTRLALWTLYGDGLVVWVEDGPPTPGFAAQVWTGHLSEDEVASLLAFADEVGFWELASSYQPEPVLSETTAEPGGIVSIQPNPEAALDQPSSLLLVVSGDRHHQVTLYPADWGGAPEAYHLMRERLLATQPVDAAPFEPVSFTLTAESVPDGSVGGFRIAEWPFVDIALADVAAAPLSLDGERGRAVADFIATGGQFVDQDGSIYKVELFADAPRAP